MCNCLPKLLDLDDYEVFNDKCLDQLISIRHYVHDAVCRLKEELSSYDKRVSEFLMTLQLVQPLNVTKVKTISQLISIKDALERSSTTSLSSNSIISFLELHDKFKLEVSNMGTLCDISLEI